MNNNAVALSRENLVDIKNLRVEFRLNRKHILYAVNNVSFSISKGETVGLVGESGCGKTTLGRAVKNICRASGGQVLFKGKNIFDMNAAERRAFTKQAQMIFQDPYSSLDPRMTVRDIIKEGMRSHRMYGEAAMNEKAEEMLDLVELPRDSANRFPHEFSGGQRQRIGIARALAVEPDFIVCDEPTSALDVSIQAQVVTLLTQLQERLGLTYLFISHDLAMVKYVSDRIVVMYMGEVVEIAPSERLYCNPLHPYTKSLLSAIQLPDPDAELARKKIKIHGDVTSPINVSPVGCKFAPRCPCVKEECLKIVLALKEYEDGHFSSCDLARSL